MGERSSLGRMKVSIREARVLGLLDFRMPRRRRRGAGGRRHGRKRGRRRAAERAIGLG